MMLEQVKTNDRKRALFFREIDNIKVLNHPNIVKFKGRGYSSNIFFFTMEYCDRGTVLDLMQRKGKPLTVDEAIPIIFDVLDALDYAHNAKIPYVKLQDGSYGEGKGIVHRDIKPKNILLKTVNNQTVAKLSDFGLAKAFDQAGFSGVTMTGVNVEGSFNFMSKGQFINFKYPKPEMDVWSTVATLYYMLTGRYPKDFNGRDPMLTVLQTKALPIHEYNQNIPHKLANLIDFALIDDPQIHFKNAIAFKNALKSLI